MTGVKVCNRSGYRASQFCDDTHLEYVPVSGIKSPLCPYHKQVHLDSTLKWQVHADCEDPSNIVTINMFVLPPVIEYYYRNRNPYYTSLPPWREDCRGIENESNFGIIYPVNGAKIFMIDEVTGETGRVVFRAAHRKSDATLYWHLDNDYIGSTTGKHSLTVSPENGKHQLTVVDNFGEMKTINFEILNK